MGKVKARKRRLRRLSLKWSFFLYAAVAVLAALAAIMLLTAICSELQSDLYDRWEMRYGEQYRIPAQLVVDGEVVGEQMAYSTSLFELVPEEEYARYTLYGRITLLSYPVVSILSILIAGVLFYRRKLKGPLRAIEEAAGRIAQNDLDFTIPALEKGNEMDRALAAMEKMRFALAASSRDLWRTLEQRRQMQAAFSHDLRTPLTILRGYSDLLKKYGRDRLTREKMLDTLAVMDSHIARLERYAATMGEAARLEEVAVAPAPAGVAALRAQMAEEGKLVCRGLAFAMEGDGDGAVCVDAALILRVFDNLVSNAARYAQTRVTAAFRRLGDVLVLCVEDDGPGFTPEGLKRAAEPYFRDKSDARDGEHFGLGLYICRTLAERHGGALSVENAPAGGACARAVFRISPPA
ncbi:MAG TPA: HAMP domain-containing histidine kinase [Candidatus Pullichristensenella avicola]|nr:HAMP domain-containing histidine kinase [Candidatus Pullichristensenella avicola]